MIDSLRPVGDFVAQGVSLAAQETVNSVSMTIGYLFFATTSGVSAVYHVGSVIAHRDAQAFNDLAQSSVSTVSSLVQAVGWGTNALFLGVPSLATRAIVHRFQGPYAPPPPPLRPVAPPLPPLVPMHVMRVREE